MEFRVGDVVRWKPDGASLGTAIGSTLPMEVLAIVSIIDDDGHRDRLLKLRPRHPLVDGGRWYPEVEFELVESPSPKQWKLRVDSYTYKNSGDTVGRVAAWAPGGTSNMPVVEVWFGEGAPAATQDEAFTMLRAAMAVAHGNWIEDTED